MELLVCQGSRVSRFTLPDYGGFVLAPGREMPVKAVVRDVDLPSDKPFGERLVPFQNLIPLLEPMKLAGDLRPEPFGVFDRSLVDPVVIFAAFDMGAGAETGRRDEDAVFLEQ